MNVSDTLAKHLLDNAPDPIVVIDENGYVLYANGRVKDVFGYAPAELVEQQMEMLLPKRFRTIHPKHRVDYFENPSPRPMGSRLELYALHKDGHEMPVEISLSPVSTDDKILVTATIRDVSLQKDLEQQLMEASRAKSRFLAAASHDLRQPIQALSLLNSVARRTATNDAQNAIIAKQQKSLDSMAKLLNALLDISKLEAGIVKPDITDCAVRDIFDDLHAEFDEQAKTKGLELIIERCEDAARSDSRLLTQILENFVSNAIRYTHDGFIQLRCLHQNMFIRLEVVDTGLGISPGQIGRIFDEYHQVETGSSRPEGLGLGLSIVKRTADLLGCTLDVRSQLGKGSTFSVIVPRGEQSRTAEEAAGQVTEPRITTGLVLVVDDEPAVLEATAMLLKMEGFEVLTATSDQEAKDHLATRTPDILITDYHLRNGTTGLDIVRVVRDRGSVNTPVIMVSGDTSDAIVLKELDGTSFLTKPVDTDELLAKISGLIGS